MWRRELKYLLRWILIVPGIAVGLLAAVWLVVVGPLFVACQFHNSCV